MVILFDGLVQGEMKVGGSVRVLLQWSRHEVGRSAKNDPVGLSKDEGVRGAGGSDTSDRLGKVK